MASAKKTTKKGSKKAAAKKAAPKKAVKKAASKKTAPKKAVKKASAKNLYKVSPLRGMDVDVWIVSKTSGWQSDVIRRMIAVVKSAAPQATTTIKWAQPVFEHNGPFAFIKPAKAHVSFGFWRGVEVADPKGILSRGDRMGHFKLTSPDQLDEGALEAMVKDAVRLNALKGNPTMRG